MREPWCILDVRLHEEEMHCMYKYIVWVMILFFPVN